MPGIRLLREEFQIAGDEMSRQERRDCASELSRLQTEIQEAMYHYESMEEVVRNTTLAWTERSDKF